MNAPSAAAPRPTGAPINAPVLRVDGLVKTFGGVDAVRDVSFDVGAFQRLAVSLDITSASDVSMDTLALVTTYRAAGHHAAATSPVGFAPIPPNAPDSKTDEYPMYWLAALDVESPSAAGTRMV